MKLNEIKCEICGKKTAHWQEHHINSKCYGGSNKNYNKCKLCLKHHNLVHSGLVVLEGKFFTLGSGVKLI